MRRALSVVLVVLGACVSSESISCPDGTVCPRDRMCRLIAESYQCVSEEQIAACDGKTDLAACAGGTCLGGVCIPPSCGDGRVGPIEVCDDGNTTSGDGCSPDCRSDETCGNGVIDLAVGESCDDGAAGGGLSHDGCSSACVDEQPRWLPLVDFYDGSAPSAATYDLARGMVVVVVAATSAVHTFELDAKTWSDVTPQISPTDRSGFTVAYDAHRRRVVMFGGLGLRDTWEWDGAAWSLLQPSTAPPARTNAAMEYDPVRRCIVLFGGRATQSLDSALDDTWTWDGVTWTQVSGPTPGRRSEAAMAFDPVRGTLVLFGGRADATAFLDDTWEFDGSTWTPRSSTTKPTPRRQHAMAFDPVSQRVLLFGGLDSGGGVATTYAWDGSDWALVASGPMTNAPILVTLPDQRRVVLLASTGMYEWAGAGWTLLAASVLGGMHRSSISAATDHDRRRVLVFGGISESGLAQAATELWRGAWSRHQGTAPPPRAAAAIAYDAGRRQFVMFGGQGINAPLDDTWVFDDTWTPRTPARSPPARSGHTMVYDDARNVVVLFGGIANATGVALADTWTWDGTTWTEVAGGPTGRSDHAATYDPIRQEMIIFGGYAGFGLPFLGDTWTWSGAWVHRTDVGPSARIATASAWDVARGRVLLFGGSSGGGGAPLNDVWEWDGTSWTQVAGIAIAGRAGHALVPSPDGAGVLRIGRGLDRAVDDLVRWRWEAPGAREACVNGEDFDEDGRRDTTCGGGDPDCWHICTPACPPGTSCPADSVGCGDGTCSAERESCRSCPTDCGACPVVCGDLACDGGETHATCAADCP